MNVNLSNFSCCPAFLFTFFMLQNLWCVIKHYLLLHFIGTPQLCLCTTSQHLYLNHNLDWCTCFLCTQCTNNTAYIDYGNDPPPAATTVIHKKSRITRPTKTRIDLVDMRSKNRVCMPDTCANKGVCYESYEDENINAAYVRQESVNHEETDPPKWMVASLIPICDCDLTTYTGSTCEAGNETRLSKLEYPVTNERDHWYMWS